MASVTITELTQPVSVEETTQNVTVSGGTSFPITIEYNATVVSDKAANGVPVGGAPGQILSKVTAADYDMAWEDAPQGFSGDYNDLTNAPDLSQYITSPLTKNIDANGFNIANLPRINTGTLSGNFAIEGPAGGISGVPNGVDFKIKNFADNGVATNTIQSWSKSNIGPSIVMETGPDADISFVPTGAGRIVIDGQRFPATDGLPGQVLKTDGTGNLEWADEAVTNVSETEPQVAKIGEQWFNPTSQILKIYTAAGWVQVTADDLQF